MSTRISRRKFLTEAALVAGAMSLRIASAEEVAGKNAFSFVFATDSHVMVNNALRSEEGIIASLRAIEAISPKPVERQTDGLPGRISDR